MMSGIDCRTMRSFRIAESRELVCKRSAIMNRVFDFQMSELGNSSYLINATNYMKFTNEETECAFVSYY